MCVFYCMNTQCTVKYCIWVGRHIYVTFDNNRVLGITQTITTSYLKSPQQTECWDVWGVGLARIPYLVIPIRQNERNHNKDVALKCNLTQ